MLCMCTYVYSITTLTSKTLIDEVMLILDRDVLHYDRLITLFYAVLKSSIFIFLRLSLNHQGLSPSCPSLYFLSSFGLPELVPLLGCQLNACFGSQRPAMRWTWNSHNFSYLDVWYSSGPTATIYAKLSHVLKLDLYSKQKKSIYRLSLIHISPPPRRSDW